MLSRRDEQRQHLASNLPFLPLPFLTPFLGATTEGQQRRKEMVRTVTHVIKPGRTAATSSFKLAFPVLAFLDSWLGRFN
jgi:hypothetical protein